MKKLRIIIITVIATLVVLFGVGYVVLRHVPIETYAVETVDTTAHWGTITGSLSYPSDFIPALGVCAQTKDSWEEYCTYEMLEGDEYIYGVGYALSVPPGTYFVFAHEVTEINALTGYQEDDYQAYYSKFITCGGTYDCPSHAPVAVTVQSDELVEDINPGDWYNF